MTGPRGLLAASLRVDAAASEAVDATIDRRGPVPNVFCGVRLDEMSYGKR